MQVSAVPLEAGGGGGLLPMWGILLNKWKEDEAQLSLPQASRINDVTTGFLRVTCPVGDNHICRFFPNVNCIKTNGRSGRHMNLQSWSVRLTIKIDCESKIEKNIYKSSDNQGNNKRLTAAREFWSFRF